MEVNMKIRNFFKYLPTFVFCGFIFTFMLLWIIIPKEHYSPQEKRVLADFPELTAETLFNGSFQKELDTYLSDHMPARNFFVGLNADYELISGRNGSKGVYLGSDDFLLPKPAQGGENLIKNAGYIKEFAEDIDIPVYMTVLPSSGYINSDKLPWNHEEYKDAELIEGVKNALGSKVKYFDSVSLFEEKASSRQLYYRTDHHWTSAGAYECYCGLGSAMGYAPVAEDRFNKETIDGFYGTSYSKSALWFVPPDNIELWECIDQSSDAVSVEIADGDDKKSGKSYFFREQLENDDKYPVFLDGNHSLVRIKNKDAKGGKIVVIKDSYAHTLVPFLSLNYSEIIMVDLRYYKKEVSALAESENADAVLVLYSLSNLSEDTNLSYLF